MIQNTIHNARAIASTLAFLTCLLFLDLVSAQLTNAAEGKFSPIWNTLCGLGSKIDEGCKQIKLRAIADSRKLPWIAIGRVNYADSRQRGHCTGTLISESHVITAAHCLFDSDRKKWLSPGNFHFVAGYSRGEIAAHSKVKRYLVSHNYRLMVKQGHRTAHNDWAILELVEPIGNKVGYLNIMKNLPDKNINSEIRLSGYAAVRQHVLSYEFDCKITKKTKNKSVLTHSCPIMDGDSGGALLIQNNKLHTIIAITSGVSITDDKPIYIAMPLENVDWEKFELWKKNEN